MSKIFDIKHPRLADVWKARGKLDYSILVPLKESDRRMFEASLGRPVAINELSKLFTAILRGEAYVALIK